MAASASSEDKEDFWIFGYGWKFDMEASSSFRKLPLNKKVTGVPANIVVINDRRVPGYIEGYVRRFWQASEDHRGTPESPGRVATLIERPYWETLGEESQKTSSFVYGAAYRIAPEHVEAVKSYLDIREINGYSIQYTQFHSCVAPLMTIPKCMVYIGLPSNPQFLGKQTPESVAKVIAKSAGPSGPNDEYLFMLDQALDGLAPESGDEHVRDLTERVRLLKEPTYWGKQVERVSAQLPGDAAETELERVKDRQDGGAVEEVERI